MRYYFKSVDKVYNCQNKACGDPYHESDAKLAEQFCSKKCELAAAKQSMFDRIDVFQAINIQKLVEELSNRGQDESNDRATGASA